MVALRIPALFLTLSASVVEFGAANNFLKKSDSITRHGNFNEETVRASLLEEIEGALGQGSTARRVARLQAALVPMYTALPKNKHGNLGHASVRYALHRLFVQRHGWYIRGLEPSGDSFNSSSPTEALDEKLPTFVQSLFENRLNGHGFNLHDSAVFAATLEHLIHQEASDVTKRAYKHNNLAEDAVLSQQQVDLVLDTYMKIYIAGDEAVDFSDADFTASYPGWDDTKDFVRDMRKNVVYSEGSHNASSAFKPDLVTRIVDEVAQHYGVFQDSECKQMKADLMKYGDKDTGLLTLSNFYQAALDHGSQQYNEPKDYLRELGALDETDPKNPFVMVPNYVNSKSNCIATSSLYSVCCINECESLLGHLEREIATPDADPKLVADVVSNMPSSSVEAPRALSAPLMYRLNEIADGHDGTVPLHGRLFGQWMHHAFPRECPFPHVSGTKNPRTPDEWMAQYGEEATMASELEMQRIVSEAASKNQTYVVKSLQWSHEEELISLHVKPPPSSIRNFFDHSVFLVAVAGALYASWYFKSGGSKCAGKFAKSNYFCNEKHFV